MKNNISPLFKMTRPKVKNSTVHFDVEKNLCVKTQIYDILYMVSGRADLSPTKFNVMQRIVLVIHCAYLFSMIKLIMGLFFVLFFT